VATRPGRLGVEAAVSLNTVRSPTPAVPHVVTCFLRRDGRVLLTRRSDAVGTYAGRWAGVSGYVEGSPDATLDDARREIREETALSASLVRAGDPLVVADGDREWTVHPFLFAADSRDVTPNEELDEWEWVHPPAMRERATVPGLWTAYERVAPTVGTVRSDREHGSTYVACRALEVLRDRAATAADWPSVAAVARDLRDARPAMAAVANRVNRVLYEADRDPAAVSERAAAALDDAVAADREAAVAAAGLLDGPVATLSRSGTALAALASADVPVVVAESRVGREGVGAAEDLARAGVGATLVPDAVLPGTLADLAGRPTAASALVGADAVLPDGAAVNRTGSYPLALAADAADRPFRVVAARDKVRPDAAVPDEAEDATAVYDGDAPVGAACPLFERVPGDLVDAVVTEDGALDADGVAAAAATHREHATWDDA
jgi:translation initiation factor 2B subunit (eIF-2B alpha/beta/delta family)/8-oxo-dGTP pyrophosphatase MutT (NUDIX family)